MPEILINQANLPLQHISSYSIHSKKKVALVCCSNGLPMQAGSQVQELVEYLRRIGLEPILSPYLYATDGVEAGTARQRAEILMEYYRDSEITAIYDVSGGDIANEILPFLDYEVIATSNKMFWGYSDLTTILNAIYARTGRPSMLYQVRNLVGQESEMQQACFQMWQSGENALMAFSYEFIQGSELQGVVVGGNIRCLLKLAGTPYWPDLTDKVLLLEARSGGAAQMTTYMSQLQQIGAFDQVSGLLLGTFTQMEREEQQPDMVTLVRRFVGTKLPVVKTEQIGHGKNSKGILIGEQICLG